MIFQEPMSSLNPCFTVGFQIAEALRAHHELDRARSAASGRSSCCGRSASPTRDAARRFPHQLSGGMSQRVMIAMAIACNPQLLIADEPTTALDVTIQAQILELLLSLQRERGMALVLITHDMGVVAETADRVVVHVCRQKVEEARPRVCSPRRAIPIPRALLAALPERAVDRSGCRRSPASCPASTIGRPAACSRRAARSPRSVARQSRRRSRAARQARVRCYYPLDESGAMPPLLEARELRRYYRAVTGLFARKGTVRAVDGVSFTLQSRRDAGDRRRSRAAASRPWRAWSTMIEPPTAGELLIDGSRRQTCRRSRAPQAAAAVQMVFQNPYGSLNPRQTVGAILEEPLAINHRDDRRRAPRRGASDDGEGRPARRSSTAAIRTCSPAASASASRSRAR